MHHALLNLYGCLTCIYSLERVGERKVTFELSASHEYTVIALLCFILCLQADHRCITGCLHSKYMLILTQSSDSRNTEVVHKS